MKTQEEGCPGQKQAKPGTCLFPASSLCLAACVAAVTNHRDSECSPGIRTMSAFPNVSWVSASASFTDYLHSSTQPALSAATCASILTPFVLLSPWDGPAYTGVGLFLFN